MRKFPFRNRSLSYEVKRSQKRVRFLVDGPQYDMDDMDGVGVKFVNIVQVQPSGNSEANAAASGNGDDQTIGQDGEDQTIGQDGNDQTIGQDGDDQTIGQDGDGQTIGQDDDDQTIGQDGDDQTISQDVDVKITGQDVDEKTADREGDETSCLLRTLVLSMETCGCTIM